MIFFLMWQKWSSLVNRRDFFKKPYRRHKLLCKYISLPIYKTVRSIVECSIVCLSHTLITNTHRQKKHGRPVETNAFTNIDKSFSEITELHYEQTWTRRWSSFLSLRFQTMGCVLNKSCASEEVKWWTQSDSGRMLVWLFVSKPKQVEKRFHTGFTLM